MYMEEENKKENIEGGEATAPEFSSNDTASETAKTRIRTKNTKKLWIAIIVIFAAVSIAGMVLYSGVDSDDDMQPVAGTHDPDYVLATVNGDSIYQRDLDTRLTESEQELVTQGVDMTDVVMRAQVESQMIADLINYKLLVQDSQAAGVEVDATEVDALIEGYVQQSGGEEALDIELDLIGLTQETFKDRVTEQLILQKYIDQNITTVEATEEDISAFYESYVAGQEGAPPLVEIKEQIATQIVTDAKQKEIEAFIAELRENADVIVN